MSKREKLTKINLYDKLNAAFVSLINPEMPGLNKLRKQNGYDKNKPTLEKPFLMEFEDFSLNGTKIRIAKSITDPAKPTILFLSAFPHSILAYSPVWNLLKKDFNLFAYDMPGFGNSETKEEYMTFKFQGEFLKIFLEKFGIGDSHIVAPDVGMASALSYVCNHSNKVKSLMIGDGPGVFSSEDPSMMKKMTKSGFWRFMFVVAGSGALTASAQNICNIKYVPNKYEVSDFKNAYKGKVSNSMKWFKGYESSIPDIDAKLSTIEIPTKIFWGEHDAILFKENGMKLNEKILNSKLEIFENAGHFVYQDDYKKFAKMVHHWVNKHN